MALPLIDQANLCEFSLDTAGSTIAATTLANVASNGFIVLGISWSVASSAPTLASVSGGGLTWTIDLQGAPGAVGAGVAIVSAQAPSGLASGTVITATLSGSAPGARVLVGQSFTVVASSTPVDVAGTIQAITSTTAWTTGNLTVAAGSLIVGFAAGLNTDGTSTPTSPSIETHDVTGGAGSYNETAAYRIESGAGTVAVAGTFSTSQSGTAGGVAYKVAAGGSAPVNTVAPAVTGTTTVGQTLSTTNGTWTGDTSSGFAYQWKDGSGNIAGATSSTYVIGAGENGRSIRCTVTATGTGGSTAQDSNTVGPIVTSDAPTLPPRQSVPFMSNQRI